MLPSAAPTSTHTSRSTLTELLHHPDVGRTSLNLSFLPDGRFRATIMLGNNWVRGHGSTPEQALEELKGNLG